jgi:hypothetical protein
MTHSNNFLYKILMFFNSLFYICHHIIFLYFLLFLYFEFLHSKEPDKTSLFFFLSGNNFPFRVWETVLGFIGLRVPASDHRFRSPPYNELHRVARFLPCYGRTNGTIAGVGCGGADLTPRFSRSSKGRAVEVELDRLRWGQLGTRGSMYGRIQPGKVSCSISLALFFSSVPRSERGRGRSDPFQCPPPPNPMAITREPIVTHGRM